MDRAASNENLAFMRNSLGIHDKVYVLLDESFFLWMGSNPGTLRLSTLTGVKNPTICTTWCVRMAMVKNHSATENLSHVERAMNLMLGVNCGICPHLHQGLLKPSVCVAKALQESNLKPFFLATLDQDLYNSARLTMPIPVITLLEGTMTVLRPRRADKVLFRAAREQRLKMREEQLQKMNQDELAQDGDGFD